jgi:beta-galactosidase GanA
VGVLGYFKWQKHESLQAVMDWRIEDKIAVMKPADPFTIYYAASSKLETEGVRRR